MTHIPNLQGKIPVRTEFIPSVQIRIFRARTGCRDCGIGKHHKTKACRSILGRQRLEAEQVITVHIGTQFLFTNSDLAIIIDGSIDFKSIINQIGSSKVGECELRRAVRIRRGPDSIRTTAVQTILNATRKVLSGTIFHPDATRVFRTESNDGSIRRDTRYHGSLDGIITFIQIAGPGTIIRTIDMVPGNPQLPLHTGVSHDGPDGEGIPNHVRQIQQLFLRTQIDTNTVIVVPVQRGPLGFECALIERTDGVGCGEFTRRCRQTALGTVVGIDGLEE